LFFPPKDVDLDPVSSARSKRPLRRRRELLKVSNTTCSNYMAGGEVHLSFAASSQTHSVQPIKLMPNCQSSNCTIHFNAYKEAYRTFLSCLLQILKLKWQDFVISSQLRLIYCIFSLRENKSHSTCKRSRDCLDCFGAIFLFHQ